MNNDFTIFRFGLGCSAADTSVFRVHSVHQIGLHWYRKHGINYTMQAVQSPQLI